MPSLTAQLIPQLLQDTRFALRQLRRTPFFSLTVLATLALAIGATAAMTGVLRATLLNPLPYPQPSRLVQVADTNLRGFKANGLVSLLRTQDLANAPALAGTSSAGGNLFSSVGYLYIDDSVLTLDGHEPIHVPAVGVSGGFFPTLAAPALLGRALTPADDVRNGPQLLVISSRLWQTAFAADPTIIGRSVRLGSTQATIVGVMPAGFDYPVGIDLWHPGHVLPSNFRGYRGEGSRFVQVIARLAPGVALASASAQATLLARRLAAAYPDTDSAWTFTVTSLRDSLFGQYRRALILLACAVALVLFVAAINIAGLQLSRNVARAPEFAVRGALGISRLRLVRQLLTESLLLVLLGSALGILLAPALLRILAYRLPPALLRLQKPHVDLPVVVFALALALAVGLLTAVVPALHSTRTLRAPSTRAVPGVRPRIGFGRTFAVLQIALSLVLLTLSAAVLQGLYRLINLPLGFQPEAVETFTVDLPWTQNQHDVEKTHRIYVAAQASLAALPGVHDVAASSALPLSDFSIRRTFDVRGQASTPQHDAVIVQGRTITPNYLQTLRIPLLAGRDLIAHDAEPGVLRVFLVNRTFAQRYFPGRSPVGQHLTYTSAELHIAPGSSTDRIDAGEIVGVTGDVAGTGGILNSPAEPELYSIEDGGWPHMQFVLRSNLPAASLQPQIRKIAAALDPTASAGHFITLSDTIDRQILQPRLNAALLTAFAALSLLLVTIGVYGLTAFELSQRTRELGLRLALGSSRAGIRNLVLAGSLRMLASGLALGLAGSLLAARLLAALVADTATPRPLLFACTIAFVVLAVLFATLVPARRAARLDPIATLRSA